jgi:hypothetical protein
MESDKKVRPLQCSNLRVKYEVAERLRKSGITRFLCQRMGGVEDQNDLKPDSPCWPRQIIRAVRSLWVLFAGARAPTGDSREIQRYNLNSMVSGSVSAVYSPVGNPCGALLVRKI